MCLDSGYIIGLLPMLEFTGTAYFIPLENRNGILINLNIEKKYLISFPKLKFMEPLIKYLQQAYSLDRIIFPVAI